jgi:alpha-D-ribose 1-methylphosphonate 5-triphosphate diphosphatase PhnM
MENPSSGITTLLSAVSMGSSQTSGGYYVGDAEHVCIQGNFTTSDAVGSFTVEGSLDVRYRHSHCEDCF